jgi:electron transfer flavoprotein alpha subunit
MTSAVLVFMEVIADKVRPSSLAAVSAARALAASSGAPVVGVIIGHDLDAAAMDAARYVSRLLVYDDPRLGSVLAETYAPLLALAVGRAAATALLGTATSTGKDILPRAAAVLGAGMASDIIQVDSPARFRRTAHAGNVVQMVEINSPIVVASVRQTAFAPAPAGAAAGTIEREGVGEIDALGNEVLSLTATQSSRPELVDAKVVVSGGRGMGAAENFGALEALADLLQGAIGASRAACDAGMAPNDFQVGQTGKIVAPQLYIAVAISGAVQHLAGMKGSKVIVAVNKDPEAPIFQIADYGLVASWEDALPRMVEEVKRRKQVTA